MKKGFVNWSGGKDALMALHQTRKHNELQVDLLLSIINKDSQKSSLHEIPLHLLKKQAESLNCKFEFVEVPDHIDNKTYQEIIHKKWQSLLEKDYQYAVFGDIFLEDIRTFREKQLQSAGLKSIFPLWKISTDQLANFFIDQKYKAIVVSCEADQLDESFCGRNYDRSFIESLPSNVDPCGENGEFHTFCYDGPLFSHPIKFNKLEKKLIRFPSPDPTKKAYKILSQPID